MAFRRAIDLLACVAIVAAPQVSERPIQQQRGAAGPILGRVVDATSGGPIRGAVVRLGGHDRDTLALTDGEGRFVFVRADAAAPVRLAATKGGYHDTEYGASGPQGMPRLLVLAAGERRGDVVIRMWKHSVITGVVRDEAGEPIAGLEVVAERRTFVAGQPRLERGENHQAHTDDRGIFRLSGLLPGSYVISVPFEETSVPASVMEALPRAVMETMGMAGIHVMQPGLGGSSIAVGDQVRGFLGGMIPPPRSGADGTLFSYPTTFYPASRVTSEAVPVTVAAGEERGGVNFELKAVPTVRVSGTLVSADASAAHRPILLLPLGADGAIGERPVARVLTDANGAFTFLAVPAGEYRVHFLKEPGDDEMGFAEAIGIDMTGGIVLSDRTFAFEKPAAAPAGEPEVLWGSTRVVAADRHVSGVTLTVRPGIRVTGTGAIEGLSAAESRQALAGLEAFAMPAGGRAVPPSTVPHFNQSSRRAIKFDERGRFDIMLPPGTYVIRGGHGGGGLGVFTSEIAMEVSMAQRAGPGREEMMLAAVQIGGLDVADSGVVVQENAVDGVVLTFSKKSAAIDGTVKTATGAADPEATVVIFPTDRSLWTNYGNDDWRVRWTRASEDGSYGFSRLPAGDYFVVAVRSDRRGGSPDPEWLAQISGGATRVSLGAGERRTVALRSAGSK